MNILEEAVIMNENIPDQKFYQNQEINRYSQPNQRYQTILNHYNSDKYV